MKSVLYKYRRISTIIWCIFELYVIKNRKTLLNTYIWKCKHFETCYYDIVYRWVDKIYFDGKFSRDILFVSFFFSHIFHFLKTYLHIYLRNFDGFLSFVMLATSRINTQLVIRWSSITFVSIQSFVQVNDGLSNL